MKENGSVNMREQRLRRKRISRIKTMVLGIIGGWILLSMIICVVLLIQVFQLRHRVEELAKNVISIDRVSGEAQDYQGSSQDNSIPQKPMAEGGKEPASVLPEESEEVSAGMGADNQPIEGVKQKVYLTFDDGPSENTARILDILKEKGVKATFFVTGNEDEEMKALYQRIVDEGHTLGIHSYSHKYSVIYDSLESFQNDFDMLRTYLTEVTGVEPSIMRFPGGSSNQVSNLDMREFIRFLNQEGVVYYDWNVSSGDATSQAYTPGELVENVTAGVKNYDTSVVLLHDSDTKSSTVEALSPMIDALLQMDMELLPIDGNTRLVQHISADSVNE